MIDVSNNNGHINWEKVAASGQKIAAIKASEGSNRYEGHFYDDVFFRYNMLAAKANGILPLPYYFARPGTKANVQARHFLELCRPYLRPGSGKLILDIEDNAGLNDEQLRSWVAEFCETLQTVTHTLTPLYSYSAFVHNFGSRFIKHPLWIANYDGSKEIPRNGIGSWPVSMVYAHQWTDKGSCPGILGFVDLSKRYKSLAKFKLGRKITW